jgi:hypothetical protein
MKRAVLLATLGLAALALSDLASASSPQSANAHLKHVFVIVLENHSQTSVVGDPLWKTATAVTIRRTAVVAFP